MVAPEAARQAALAETVEEFANIAPAEWSQPNGNGGLKFLVL